jgi:hypothetical protein
MFCQSNFRNVLIGVFSVMLILLIIWFFIPMYKEPRIIKKVLNDEECDQIRQIASSSLKKSMVIDIVNGGKMLTEGRKSENTYIHSSTNPVVEKLIRKCLRWIDRPFENCEMLQVTKYLPGGFYLPHFDTCSTFEPNNRMYTFIIALNDGYEGGYTNFPNLGKKYKMRKGDALLFNLFDNYKRHTEKAFHGGTEVTSGEKWICNLWVHEHNYGQP